MREMRRPFSQRYEWGQAQAYSDAHGRAVQQLHEERPLRYEAGQHGRHLLA